MGELNENQEAVIAARKQIDEAELEAALAAKPEPTRPAYLDAPTKQHAFVAEVDVDVPQHYAITNLLEQARATLADSGWPPIQQMTLETDQVQRERAKMRHLLTVNIAILDTPPA